jgi:flagellar basal-body rod protein FlgC
VNVVEIRDDNSPGKKVYRPGHPHADERGMVQMPNVEVTKEMVDLITASRSYEANLTVVRTARQMAQQALRIGR